MDKEEIKKGIKCCMGEKQAQIWEINGVYYGRLGLFFKEWTTLKHVRTSLWFLLASGRVKTSSWNGKMKC